MALYVSEMERKDCAVLTLQSEPIVRRANIVQHTSLRVGYGDGFVYPSGYSEREGSDVVGRKPANKLHGVAISWPQKPRETSQNSTSTDSTEVLLDASRVHRRVEGKWYRVAARKPC